MAETVVLDPSAVATGRTQVDITNYISAGEGVDWGDAAIEAYLAKGHIGSTPVDFDVPNRTVTIPLVLKAVGATTFESIRAQVQAKVALFHREGGYISRQTSIGTMYGDVVSASLHYGGDWLQAYKSVDVNAVLSLEVRPDWYGSEITLDDMVETTAPNLIRVLKLSAVDAVVAGDYPGRVRVVVDEDDADPQLGLLWGFRSRYYDSAATAALSYQAGSLTPLDTAGTTTLSGAAGTVIRHGTLSTNWTPVLKTTILAGTTELTHRGSYRTWARCYSTATVPPDVRFLYDVGDFVFPVENDARSIPAANNFYWMNLGEIRIDPVPVGTHRWQGVIQAKGASGGESVFVDKLDFQPLDDGAGMIQAVSSSDPGLSAFTARDEFNQTAGTVTGKTAAVGGVYTGGGGTADWNMDATNHWVTRTTVTGDASLEAGRYILSAATASAAQVVQADVYLDAATEYAGVIGRYTDTNNWFRALIGMVNNVTPGMVIGKRVTGTVSNVVNGAFGTHSLAAWYTVRLRIDANGQWFVWVFRQGGAAGSPVAAGQDSALATAGALATGKVGFYGYRPALP